MVTRTIFVCLCLVCVLAMLQTTVSAANRGPRGGNVPLSVPVGSPYPYQVGPPGCPPPCPPPVCQPVCAMPACPPPCPPACPPPCPPSYGPGCDSSFSPFGMCLKLLTLPCRILATCLSGGGDCKPPCPPPLCMPMPQCCPPPPCCPAPVMKVKAKGMQRAAVRYAPMMR